MNVHSSMISIAALAAFSFATLPASADGMEGKTGTAKKVVKTKKTQTRVAPVAAGNSPAPEQARSQTASTDSDQPTTEFVFSTFAATGYLRPRQGILDHDGCIGGAGLDVRYSGFYAGVEGLIACDDDDTALPNSHGKKKKKKHYDYESNWNSGWGHNGHNQNLGNSDFDRIALIAGWGATLDRVWELDLKARHEFADNDVTTITGLFGRRFIISDRDTFMPYTGVEVLLTDDDADCVDDTLWTLPFGIKARHRFDGWKLVGDGSVNFSDDERSVAAFEIAATIPLDVFGTKVELVPSGIWAVRLDDGDTTPSTPAYGYRGRYGSCQSNLCNPGDDDNLIGRITLRIPFSG